MSRLQSGDVMQLQGEIRVGEAAKVAPLVHRALGVPRVGFWAQVLIGGVIAAVAFGIGGLAERVLGLPSLAGAAIGAVLALVGLRVYQSTFARMMQAGFRRSGVERGLQTVLPAGLDLDETGVRYAHGHQTITTSWPGMTGLVRAGDYWVFLADYQPLYLPRRWFFDAAQEAEFLRQALAHMSPEARARSADAVRAAGEPAA